MSIPIASPELGIGALGDVIETVEGARLADGPPVRAFEAAFADYCGRTHGIATSNGTTALHAALRGLEIGPGDTVVTTPFSFVATANAIRLCGADPAFADVDPRTLNIDPDAVRAAIEVCDGDVDAILAVHLYGLPAEMDELREIAEENGIPLIEDAAQAHGASYRGDPVGSLGDVACFSFYPTKNITTGEGGIVVTDDSEVADRVARFINHGRSGRYDHDIVGHNFRLTSIGAAIGSQQLRRLDDFVEIRRRNAAAYDRALADHPSVSAPIEPSGTHHAYHQYTVQCSARAALQEHLADADVDTGVYYPTPIHRQPAYADVEADAPEAERAADRVLSVPVHPTLNRSEVRAIADALAGFEP
ncbi:DegT/DnrJ/EryC1/StrS family aminotransferase [Halobellus salinisoli]|uniref:DegT/DnrJ/EryC1/StrS family aminotransferase n=1 Tax=Halobellus salinisoli TaxID=3108500 RepID=UPI003008DBB6